MKPRRQHMMHIAAGFALVRGRGLKLMSGMPSDSRRSFALVRGRGLKPPGNVGNARRRWFALVRGRGLKQAVRVEDPEADRSPSCGGVD